jgi:hypothetical protein
MSCSLVITTRGDRMNPDVMGYGPKVITTGHMADSTVLTCQRSPWKNKYTVEHTILVYSFIASFFTLSSLSSSLFR